MVKDDPKSVHLRIRTVWVESLAVCVLVVVDDVDCVVVV